MVAGGQGDEHGALEKTPRWRERRSVFTLSRPSVLERSMGLAGEIDAGEDAARSAAKSASGGGG